MSDIFVSYASQERDRVLPLVSALERTGWSIFWDRTIPAGKTWRQVIGSEIRTCRSVQVIWTERSVPSEWVLEEGETGKRRQILIPVLLDNVEPPFGFGNIQAANLTAWNGDSSSPSFTHLVADIATILGPAPTAVKEAEERRRPEAEAQRKTEEEHLREQERQRFEEETKRKAEEENRKGIEEERNRAQQEAERRRLEAGAQRKAEEERLRQQERQRSEQEANRARRFTRSGRGKLYAGGAFLIVIGLAVMAFWFFGLARDVPKNVSTEADVPKNVSTEADAKKNVSTEADAKKNVLLEADATGVATRIQQYIKTAGFYRERGKYLPALEELAKAKSLDPANKAV